MDQLPSILIAIASYGTAQDHYLEKLLSEFRKMRAEKRIVVLSDRDKQVIGAEVLAGLPSNNPYSLPFAHRKLFADNANKFDLFMYTEDDTFLTEKHIKLFHTTQEMLQEDEIVGFIRSEQSSEGKKYITSINTLFRWLPESVVKRNGELFAQLSNQHSGCFIVTRKQLKKAIESGGFLVKPYKDTYGMLETAASDIYTRCGLRRLICISRIKDFIVPHLPNKYYQEMGISIEEMEFQIRSLIELHQNGRWNGSLFNPQTRLPGFRGSKTLFERPDEKLLAMIPKATKSILSIGCGLGETEFELNIKGLSVTAVPIDSVFGEALRARGIRSIEGSFNEVIEVLKGQQFDAVLIANVLHLVKNPVYWLQKIKHFIVPGGCLIASVSNISEILSWLKDWKDGCRRPLYPSYNSFLAHSVNSRKLRNWLRTTGLEIKHFDADLVGWRQFIKKLHLEAIESAFAARFIVVAKRS